MQLWLHRIRSAQCTAWRQELAIPHLPDRNGVVRKLWLAAGWLLVLAIIYLSLTPHPIDIPVEQGDKIGHLLAYGALMLWFAQVYVKKRQRIVVAAASIALGVGLEFAQLLTDTRMFEVADMLADGTGVLIGWALAPPRT